MRTYLLTMYYPAGSTAPSPESLMKIMREIGEVRQQLQAAGKWVFGGGLHAASDASVVRPRDGKVVITDGPFTESKEQMGGITIIRGDDLDEALRTARRYADITGIPIEIRPFQEERG